MAASRENKTKRANATGIIDPVCGMSVSPRKVNLVVTYEGEIYHFCAMSCREAFEKAPEKYVGMKTPKQKGWLTRYLDRLTRTNEQTFGASGPKCH